MFEVKGKNIFVKNLHKIICNYNVIFNDGENDIFYTGTNRYGNLILGVIMFEEEDLEYIRYIHILTTDYQLLDFYNKKISLLSILKENESFFLVDKNYSNEELSVNLVTLEEIPEEFIPLENSFCPDFIYESSFNYSVSLKGNLADNHKSTPEDVNIINTNFSAFLRNSSEFMNDLDYSRQVYVEPSMVGSFRINFKIELKENSNALFQAPVDKLNNYFNKYLNYVLNTLPTEEIDVFKHESVSSIEFNKIKELLTEIYLTKNITQQDIEQKIIDQISFSVTNLKEINYNNSFDRIELMNLSKTGNEIPLAIINKDYIPAIENKVFSELPIKKEDIIEIDEIEKKYSIQVYDFNSETGNGGVYIEDNGGIKKVALHLKGLNDYSNSIYTKSMDDKKYIEVLGIAKRVNSIIKELTIKL